MVKWMELDSCLEWGLEKFIFWHFCKWFFWVMCHLWLQWDIKTNLVLWWRGRKIVNALGTDQSTNLYRSMANDLSSWWFILNFLRCLADSFRTADCAAGCNLFLDNSNGMDGCSHRGKGSEESVQVLYKQYEYQASNEERYIRGYSIYILQPVLVPVPEYIRRT